MKIDEAYVYKHFPEQGFTTAGLVSELKTLKESHVNTIRLTPDDAQLLSQIISNARKKRHRQTKTGGGACFGILRTGSEKWDMVILNNLIIDMTNRINYWIKDESDESKLAEVVMRIKAQN
jgi:hypothetical protein